MPDSTPIEIDAAGRTVPESSPDKVFFSERGETKLDLIRYYLAVEAEVLRALGGADVAHLAWAVNIGCLGFHVWPYHADDPDHADELRIDLDPSPGVTFA